MKFNWSIIGYFGLFLCINWLNKMIGLFYYITRIFYNEIIKHYYGIFKKFQNHPGNLTLS